MAGIISSAQQPSSVPDTSNPPLNAYGRPGHLAADGSAWLWSGLPDSVDNTYAPGYSAATSPGANSGTGGQPASGQWIPAPQSAQSGSSPNTQKSGILSGALMAPAGIGSATSSIGAIATPASSAAGVGAVTATPEQSYSPSADAAAPIGTASQTQETQSAQPSAAGSAASSTAPTGINMPSSQMSTDWLNGFKPGTPAQSWAGGALSAVDSNGNRVFTTSDGKQTTVNANTNIADLARNNQGVAAQWQTQYGYTPSAAAADYEASKLGDPTKWGVTSDQTVQGQLSHMMDPNNPLYQQWVADGRKSAAANGILNGSMAETAAQDSLMRNAVPIATSDASLYAKAAGYNADENNVFSVANNNSANTAGQFNAGQANQLAQSNLSADTQKYASNLSAETQKSITNMNNASQQLVSQAHDANATLIQNNQAAAQAYNTYVTSIANIDEQAGMDAAAKATAISTITNTYNAQIAGIKAALPTSTASTSPLDVNAPSPSASPSASAAGPAAQVGGVDVGSFLNFNNGNLTFNEGK